MFLSLLAVSLVSGASVVAAQSSSVVCVAGQCLEGFSNTTIGATLSADSVQTSVLLLPGQYTTDTNPQLLHELLTSSSASISPSSGFSNSSSSSAVSLPLDVSLQPGLAVYPQSLFSGEGKFASLPTTPIGNSSSSTPLTAGSLALSSDIWVAIEAGSSSNRYIFWDSVPDVSQLPSSLSSSSLSLFDVQSSACSPPCSSSGVCSSSGTCTCPTGFTGSSCESCSSNFFGPNCQACPDGCEQCDDGISGSGQCIKFSVSNSPESCNCLNGQCGSDGQCTCNAGWTTAENGTTCAKCATGFFQDSDGNCSVCQLGCSQCADGNGDCLSCASGFTQDANDQTKCIASASTTSSGTTCPDGSFSNGTSCEPCSSSCSTCKGATSNDCIICGSGRYSLNGTCVPADGNGVCEGSSMIADNNKHECDACPAKCTSCQIPNFDVASTVNEAQCTGCLPGFVLSNGQCVDSCPSGTFLSPQDNLTCTACDSSCSTCAGSSDFCLTCANNQLASSGKCVASCPSNTFSSSGQCLSCHPDCETCSGGAFNQCSSCPSERPVPGSGRCLPTCSQSQYFDTSSSSCQSCESSCYSCSGSGPSNCLACSSSSQRLQGGSCVDAGCNGSSTVISGLGVCLSDLVTVPQASGTSSASPLPSISGLTDPVNTTTRKPLEWWEILLMTLGCAFILLVVLWFWRRRARKQRAKRTQQFAIAKNLDRSKLSWRWRLLNFGERLFGHKPTQPVRGDEESAIRLTRVGDAKDRDSSGDSAFDRIYNAYNHSPVSDHHDEHEHYPESLRSLNRMTGNSLYTHITGLPPRTPEVRQPVKEEPLRSRFSMSTVSGTSSYSDERPRQVLKKPAAVSGSDAQIYAHEQASLSDGMSWIQPTHTGGSSKNPFRR